MNPKLGKTFILDFDTPPYEYWEDINEGVLLHFPPLNGQNPQCVLDVGCGRGALGGAIKNHGYFVWGLDSNHSSIGLARPRLDRVIEADLHDLRAVGELIGDRKFDYIVFSDVLEHLADPHAVLLYYLRFLAEGGSVIISVPNIANWLSRAKLAFGFFDYQYYGVMDRTHLRFFTRKTLVDLNLSANLNLISLNYTPLICRAFVGIIKKTVFGASESNSHAIVDSNLYFFYQRFIYPIEHFFCRIFPTFLSFRMVSVSRKAVKN